MGIQLMLQQTFRLYLVTKWWRQSTVGQSQHKIEIDWQTPGTYVLSVNAVNSCGVSNEQKMNIKVSGADEKILMVCNYTLIHPQDNFF
jgi:hypothetical protein